MRASMDIYMRTHSAHLETELSIRVPMANEINAEEGHSTSCDIFRDQEAKDEVFDALSLCDWVDEDGTYREVEQSFTEEQNAESDYFEFSSEDYSVSHDFPAKNIKFFGKIILSRGSEETSLHAQRSISENSSTRRWRIPKLFLGRKLFSRSNFHDQNCSSGEDRKKLKSVEVLCLPATNKFASTRQRDQSDKSGKPSWPSLLIFGSALNNPYKEMNLAAMKTRQFRKCPSSPTMLRSPDNKEDGEGMIGGDEKWFWKLLRGLGCVAINGDMAMDASMENENVEHV